MSDHLLEVQEKVDDELFELCKRVWEKTGWGEKNIKGYGPEPLCWYAETAAGWLASHLYYEEYREVPLYTSDYLLEKLPANILSKVYPDFYAQLWTRKNQDDDDGELEPLISPVYHGIFVSKIKELGE